VALQVHANHIVPLFLGQVEHHPVAQDRGQVDQPVQPPPRVQGRPDNALATLHGRDIGEVGDGLTTRLLDLLHHLGGRAAIRPRTVRVHPGVVNHHPRAFRCRQQGAFASDATARAGHCDDLAFEQVAHGLS